jgi:hypothetical protein
MAYALQRLRVTFLSLYSFREQTGSAAKTGVLVFKTAGEEGM